MGTPEFAVPSLDMLFQEGYEIAAVVTQPDKPKGRGNKMAMPPVKEVALEKGIKVLQPEKVKTAEFISELKELNPDLLVTAAYGKILPKDVLDIPKSGCINVHGSLLPKYRGAAPLQWSIILGEKVTGVTTMFTDVGMDTGDMLLKSEIMIPDEMTAGELHDKMAAVGADVLKKTLKMLEAGTLHRAPQNNGEATYAPMIRKETGKIDWTKGAGEIYNLVRGTDPWPGAYTFYKGERMRIWKTGITEEDSISAGCLPGKIVKVSKEGILVCTGGEGLIHIREIQFDSSKRMPVGEYIRGHEINEGEVLG